MGYVANNGGHTLQRLHGDQWDHLFILCALAHNDIYIYHYMFYTVKVQRATAAFSYANMACGTRVHI